MSYHTPDGEPTYACPNCRDTGWVMKDAHQRVDAETGELVTFKGTVREECKGDPMPDHHPDAKPCHCNPVAHRRWREGHYNRGHGEGCAECSAIREGKVKVGRDIDPETGNVYVASLA